MYLFAIYDKGIFDDEGVIVAIKAYDLYEAETRCKELFPAEFYNCYNEEIFEFTKEEVEILGYEIY